MVLSIKAMLEARMVAARTHGPARAEQGAPAIADRTTASSHGGFMKSVDALSQRQGSKIIPADENLLITPARSGFTSSLRLSFFRLPRCRGVPPRLRLVVIRRSIHVVEDAAIGIEFAPFAFLDGLHLKFRKRI